MSPSSATTDIEAQFSPDAMSPKPVIAWNTFVSRPTSTEKKATTTKPRPNTPDHLLLRIKPKITQLLEDEEG
jgi:hypothetical protein